MRVVLVQMSVKDGDVNNNLKKIKKMIEIVEGDIYLTPELSLTGFKDFLSENDVSKMTKDLPCVGVGFREKDGDEKYNAYAISCNGNIIYKRRKYMLFKPMKEHEELRKGELPRPFVFKDIKLAINICYEVRFPELFWPLAKDVHAFVVPAAWPKVRVKAWRTLVRARAMENFAYVLGINRWGGGLFGPFGGNSLAVLPNGEELMVSEGEGVLIVNVDRELVSEAREFPAFEDRLRLMR